MRDEDKKQEDCNYCGYKQEEHKQCPIKGAFCKFCHRKNDFPRYAKEKLTEWKIPTESMKVPRTKAILLLQVAKKSLCVLITINKKKSRQDWFSKSKENKYAQ